MMWLCAGSVSVVVAGTPHSVIDAESLIGQHSFVSSKQQGACITCVQACEYLEIQGEGLEKEAKQLQESQEQLRSLSQQQQRQQPKAEAVSVRNVLISSQVFRIKKLLRNGVPVAAFKQNPLTKDKRVLDGADAVWQAYMATLSASGVLSMHGIDDTQDEVTASVAQALVMTGSASHPLLARHASFCLAVSSSVAYFVSCSDELQRSEWLQALATAGAIIENPDLLVGAKDTLAEVALQHQHAPILRDSGNISGKSDNSGANSSGSIHQQAVSDSVPPAPPPSRKKAADPLPAPKSPSVNTPTPAPVLAPAQAPPLLPPRSSPLSDSLPPPSPISHHSSSHETFALQVSSFSFPISPACEILLTTTPPPPPSSPFLFLSARCASPPTCTPTCRCLPPRMT
jgi:hypothetical protein